MPDGADPVLGLYELIDEIDTALLITRRSDGSLASRPMATQNRAAGADFWFVTSADSAKLDELARDHRVNVSYYRERTRDWVSIAGTAALTSDIAKIRELWRPGWKAWFGDEDLADDARAGTAEDPRIVLIGVTATSARLMAVDRPKPVVLFEVVQGVVTGTHPQMARERPVTADEIGAKPPRA